MARDRLILPRADSGCGKVFYDDRRTADGHRIALEFWNRATGNIREGYQLSVYRCKRCGGFHIGQRRIEKLSVRPDPQQLDPGFRYSSDQQFGYRADPQHPWGSCSTDGASSS